MPAPNGRNQGLGAAVATATALLVAAPDTLAAGASGAELKVDAEPLETGEPVDGCEAEAEPGGPLPWGFADPPFGTVAFPATRPG